MNTAEVGIRIIISFLNSIAYSLAIDKVSQLTKDIFWTFLDFFANSSGFINNKLKILEMHSWLKEIM